LLHSDEKDTFATRCGRQLLSVALVEVDRQQLVIKQARSNLPVKTDQVVRPTQAVRPVTTFGYTNANQPEQSIRRIEGFSLRIVS